MPKLGKGVSDEVFCSWDYWKIPALLFFSSPLLTRHSAIISIPIISFVTLSEFKGTHYLFLLMKVNSDTM